MKPSERRQAMKEEMAQRQQESYNSKDDSGKFKSIYVKGNLGNTQMWKCSEDEHFINIIPYVAGAQNPNVKEGKLAYNLDIQVHRKVGVNEDSYICLSRSFNKKCPICDEQAELRKQDDYDEKYVKSLNPTRRVIYNIECLDSDKEVKKGIQLFEVSHWLFEKELAELSKKPRGGGFILFSDPDDGKTVMFRKKGTGPTNTEYKAFQFMDREEPISDAILDGALCLDELIHIPTYDEVYAAFHGTEAGESDHHEEEKEPVQESRGPARRSAPVKEEKFVCPGNTPEDFGELEACDNCPDASKCEEAFNALESGEEAEPVKEEVKAPPVARRTRTEATEPAPEKQEEAPAGQRVRRRPSA